jgi:SHS2 domain-containing protein
MNRYRLFDHTADLGVQVFGTTVRELFKNGAYALFDLMAELDHVQLALERTVTATGSDWDDLWVNYLRECLYMFNGERLLFSNYDIVTIDQGQVSARMQGEAFNPVRHTIRQEIKAVTYHQASISETPRGWTGKIIFDI